MLCNTLDTYNTIILKQMINVRIDEDLETRLNRLSKETGRTKSYYVKEALSRYIEEVEGIYLAESRAEEIELGKSKTFTLEEARKILNENHNS